MSVLPSMVIELESYKTINLPKPNVPTKIYFIPVPSIIQPFQLIYSIMVNYFMARPIKRASAALFHWSPLT